MRPVINKVLPGKRKYLAKARTSSNARAVAKEVIRKLEAGEKIRLGEILLKQGYAKTTSTVPAIVTSTPAYREEMDTYVARLEKHRASVLAAMEKKDLTEEQYRTLADAQTKLTHDVQLLTGGKTENVGMEEDRKTLKAIVAAIQIEE